LEELVSSNLDKYGMESTFDQTTYQKKRKATWSKYTTGAWGLGLQRFGGWSKEGSAYNLMSSILK